MNNTQEEEEDNLKQQNNANIKQESFSNDVEMKLEPDDEELDDEKISSELESENENENEEELVEDELDFRNHKKTIVLNLINVFFFLSNSINLKLKIQKVIDKI